MNTGFNILNVKVFIPAFFILVCTCMTAPQLVLAECEEYKIVEFEDRVELVCVGELLTDEQKKAIRDEELRKEAEIQAHRNEELRLLKQNFQMNKNRPAPEPEAEP